MIYAFAEDELTDTPALPVVIEEEEDLTLIEKKELVEIEDEDDDDEYEDDDEDEDEVEGT